MLLWTGDASLPQMYNQCGVCKDTCTIEWTDCKMHNPATGTQMAKDFNKLFKNAKSPKPCAPVSLSTHCSNLPPRCNCTTHSNYHVDNCCHSTKCRCSPSHLCSHLRSCDHHNDAQRSHRSSCSHVDTNFAIHDNVCPSIKPYFDITGRDPVNLPSKTSEVSSHSDGPDHSAWHINPDENPYHLIHFDSHGNHEFPITATYSSTYLVYESKKHFTLATNPIQTHCLLLTFAITLILRPKKTLLVSHKTWQTIPSWVSWSTCCTRLSFRT